MPMLPDSIDFGSIALWAGGITTVLASIGIAIWQALQRAKVVAASLPAPVTRQQTTIVTADTVATERLTAALEARNVEAIEAQKMFAELAAVLQLAVSGIEANTRSLAKATDEVGEARNEIIRLTHEIIRSSRG